MAHHDHDNHHHHHGSDHHHHEHDHDHHHDHSHGHGSLSFSEKLVKLLEHWIQHNDHHAEDYRKWAAQSRENGQDAVAELLDSAAELTDTITERFRDAGGKVK